jgi:hypothetical protein
VVYVRETQFDRTWMERGDLRRTYKTISKALGQTSLNDIDTQIVGYKLVEVYREKACKIRGIPYMIKTASKWLPDDPENQ